MPSFMIVRLQTSEIKHGQTHRQTDTRTDNVIYIYKSHCRFVYLSVCLCVCLSALNLRSLKSHDHETWHVGPLSDVGVHGLSGILIFGRVPPQAHAA